MRTFVMGDIHGAHRAMLQCFERSGFDRENDRLIQLGDVADGWPEVPECIEELLKIKNLIQIKGNHDHWMDEWLQWGKSPIIWTEQGGRATIEAYVKRNPELMVKHRDYWKTAPVRYVDEKNRHYCHGGWNEAEGFRNSSEEDVMWDRHVAIEQVGMWRRGTEIIHPFAEHIFLGHTTVNSFNLNNELRNLPITSGNVTLLDTGAGWEGKLTIMDADTKEYWQSDVVRELYPQHKMR